MFCVRNLMRKGIVKANGTFLFQKMDESKNKEGRKGKYWWALDEEVEEGEIFRRSDWWDSKKSQPQNNIIFRASWKLYFFSRSWETHLLTKQLKLDFYASCFTHSKFIFKRLLLMSQQAQLSFKKRCVQLASASYLCILLICCGVAFKSKELFFSLMLF